LVVEQISKRWKVKEPRIQTLVAKAWQELKGLPLSYTIVHIPRAQNAYADRLVNQALDAQLS
jgi:ribonuclease HI